MSAPQPSSVLVIGGGPAGYTFVDQLRLRGYRGELTLIDPRGLPMDRPPLSKEFLRGAMGREELRFREAEWFEERSITVITGVVEEISGVRLSEDAAGWEVFLENGPRLLSEVVVLATGTVPTRPELPGLDELAPLTFYTIDDAEELAPFLRPGSTVGVIGAGLVGAEAASVAAERGAEVLLVSPRSPAAVRSFGEEAAAHLHAKHEPRGVRLITGTVRSVTPAEVAPGEPVGRAATLTLENGESAGVDVLVIATGSVPCDGLGVDAGAQAAGDEAGGGLLVDAAGRTSLPNLWAIGDVARGVDATGAPLPQHAHWEAAMHSAEDAAAALLGQFPEERGARWFWSDRHGEHVEVVGTQAPVEGGAVVRREDARGLRGVFTLGAGGELLGAVTFDDARLARAARRLIDRAKPVDAAALADTEVSAKDLVRPPRRD